MSTKANQKRRVVVIGGGNGSAIAIVALKQNLERFDISSVVSMSDSNGSSGRLRREFKTLPPGDIMRVVLAMSVYDYPILKDIFYRPRFKNSGKLDSHNLGNLFLTLSAKYCGSFLKSVSALSQSVKAVGQVYPATLRQTDLVAELTNGDIIRTEGFIDRPRYNRGFKIKKVWLEPKKARAYVPALKAIKQADYVILSPGSLYTSLIAALLPVGIKAALAKTKAKLIYTIGNAYHTHGETGPEKLSDFVKQLERYLPRPLDLVIYNNHQLNPLQKKKYKERGWAVFAKDTQNLPGRRVMGADFERAEGGLCSIRLGKILKKVLK